MWRRCSGISKKCKVHGSSREKTLQRIVEERLSRDGMPEFSWIVKIR